MNWKIQVSEPPMQFYGFTVVSLCCISWIFVMTYVLSFLVHADTCAPFADSTLPVDTLESAGVVRLRSFVPSILCNRTFPQIPFAVVQRVMVSMVGFITWSRMENLSVHVNDVPDAMNSRAISSRIETLHLRVPTGIPIPLTEPMEVSSIDDGILIFRESNKTIGCVERLSNRMPRHRLLGHESSSKGLLLSAAILT